MDDAHPDVNANEASTEDQVESYAWNYFVGFNHFSVGGK
jgi:hypothetical protein